MARCIAYLPLALVCCSAFCSALRATDLSQAMAILARDRNPERLVSAGVAVAESKDPQAIKRLANFFTEPSFLRRLDPGSASVVHLGQIFRALASHPSEATATLCIVLANDTGFTAVPARLNFLLNALAAVRPMSVPAAKVFRDTDNSGYAEVNGPLLAKNASPQALQVLEGLFADESLDAAQRVSVAHWSLLPVRTNPAIIMMCARLLNEPGASHDVQLAILESLYDYQPRQWFGMRAGQPSPPPWSSATPAAADLLRSLGTRSLKRQDLPPQLRSAIENTLAQLHL